MNYKYTQKEMAYVLYKELKSYCMIDKNIILLAKDLYRTFVNNSKIHTKDLFKQFDPI